MKSKYYNKSQAALIAVMGTFAADGFPKLTLAEAAEKTGLGKDTVFRTLYMLHDAGWLEKSGDYYRLSQVWPKLGYDYGEILAQEVETAKQRLRKFQE